MTNEEQEDAISFFKEVAEKEVNNAKYSKLAIEALEQKHQTIGHPHITNVNELFPKIHELNQAIFDKGYKDGLNDAWKCARKITCDINHGGYSVCTLREIFGIARLGDIILNNSPSEAIAKIKEYEEKQKQANDEIKVGDEVIDGEVFNSGKGIVTFVSPLLLYVLWYDGSTGKRKLEDVKKSGRHFDQITGILEQLNDGINMSNEEKVIETDVCSLTDTICIGKDCKTCNVHIKAEEDAKARTIKKDK